MNVIRTVLAHPTGVELVYTTNEGQYLGRLRMEGLALAVANGLRGN